MQTTTIFFKCHRTSQVRFSQILASKSRYKNSETRVIPLNSCLRQKQLPIERIVETGDANRSGCYPITRGWQIPTINPFIGVLRKFQKYTRQV
uniref:Uncharacterized protein n=1 Tax=Mus musculus TaxID=10090 RepID=Q3U167_MOUSE|nr:unnamed protein product [Mus musculus]